MRSTPQENLKIRPPLALSTNTACSGQGTLGTSSSTLGDVSGAITEDLGRRGPPPTDLSSGRVVFSPSSQFWTTCFRVTSLGARLRSHGCGPALAVDAPDWRCSWSAEI